jgi:hypothetical protein
MCQPRFKFNGYQGHNITVTVVKLSGWAIVTASSSFQVSNKLLVTG